MTSKLKKIILVIVGALILFVVYAVFFKKGPEVQELINTGDALSPEAQILGNQISQALLRIEQIKLDRGIFTNNIYMTLVDRSEPISEEPIGRANPFAPIGDVSVSSRTSTSTATSTSNSRTSSRATSTPSGNTQNN